MGLLDDAIREHLELKRQRGADPDEVARQERDVLAPLQDHDHDLESDEPNLGIDDREPTPSPEREVTGAHGSAPADWEEDVQETAEIDMRTVLEALDAEDEASWAEARSEPRSGGARPAPARVEGR